MVRLFVADLKMIVRNRQGLFWALVFPLIFVAVFGLFRLDDMGSAKIAVIDQAQDDVSRAIIANLRTIELLNLTQDYDDEAIARQKLQEGQDGIEFVLVLPAGLEKA